MLVVVPTLGRRLDFLTLTLRSIREQDVAADIVAADECDSCLDCEWTTQAIIEETGCDEATAERAIGLYARALREMAAIHCAA